MAQLAKMEIRVEGGTSFKAGFNPNKLSYSKSVNWEKQNAKGRDVPELQFKNAEPRTLTLELVFDTYDNSDVTKKSVREYTDNLLKLMLVDGDKHRPPVCELFWGKVFFKCVLEKLEQQFTLFMEDGTPVRAKCQCTFKEWRSNQLDQRYQDNKSSDIAKTRVVKRGDTLSGIAAEEFLDPGLWRAIAEENCIDDPGNLVPGTVLLIPTLTGRAAIPNDGGRI